MMDIDKLSAEIGISPESYRKLIQLYIDQTTEDLKLLETAIDSGNFGKVKDYCHHIKGASLNLELTEISKIAKNMEELAKKNSLEQLKVEYTSLRKKFDNLVHYFRAT